MRGIKDSQVSVACLLDLETMIPADHPLCAIKGVRDRGVTPHPAACAQRRTLGVRIRLNAYALSQKARRRIEEILGWSKTTGCFRKSRHRGAERTHAAGQNVVAACNLVRRAKLSLGPPVFARAQGPQCPRSRRTKKWGIKTPQNPSDVG